MKNDMKSYYAERAREYDAVYLKEERQSDLIKAKSIIKDLCKNKRVVEIACGTGYWTQIISETASIIKATDINKEMLDVASERLYSCTIEFSILDAFNPGVLHNFSLCFIGFLWSHIDKNNLPSLIKVLNDSLDHNAKVIWMDSRYVEGSSTPISRIDESGNTYQIRKLKNDETYEVMKNFPDENEIQSILNCAGIKRCNILSLHYYWIVSYNN